MDPNAGLDLPFELTVEHRAQDVVMTLRGELDLAAKEHYEQQLEQLKAEKLERLIVDLRPLTFIDSTAIGLLVTAWRRSQRDGYDAVFVLPLEGQVPRALEIAGLERLIPTTRVDGQTTPPL